MSDPVTQPSHYTFAEIEPLDAIEAWGLDFCKGNVVKYIVRAGRKATTSELEDLKKARVYLERAITAAEQRAGEKQKVVDELNGKTTPSNVVPIDRFKTWAPGRPSKYEPVPPGTANLLNHPDRDLVERAVSRSTTFLVDALEKQPA